MCAVSLDTLIRKGILSVIMYNKLTNKRVQITLEHFLIEELRTKETLFCFLHVFALHTPSRKLLLDTEDAMAEVLA